MLQFPFSHVEHLVARAKIPEESKKGEVQVFTSKICENFLEALYTLYASYKEQKEHALCIFAFIAEIYSIIEEYLLPTVTSKFTTLIKELIN